MAYGKISANGAIRGSSGDGTRSGEL